MRQSFVRVRVRHLKEDSLDRLSGSFCFGPAFAIKAYSLAIPAHKRFLTIFTP